MKEFTLEYNTSNLATMRCFGKRCSADDRRRLTGGLALQMIRQLELRFPPWTFRATPYSTDRDRFYMLQSASADVWELELVQTFTDEIGPLIYKRVADYPEVIDQLNDRELALFHQTSRFPVHDQTAPDIFRTLVTSAQRVLPLDDVAISASIWPRVRDGAVIIAHYSRSDLRTSAHLSLGAVDLDCAVLIHEIAHVLTMAVCGAHPEHDEVFIDHLKRLLAAFDDDALHRLKHPVTRQVKETDLGMQGGVDFFLWCGDDAEFGLDLAGQPCDDVNDGMAWSYERVKDSLPRRMQSAMVWFEGEFVGVSGVPEEYVPDPIEQGLMDGTLVFESDWNTRTACAAGPAADGSCTSDREPCRDHDLPDDE